MKIWVVKSVFLNCPWSAWLTCQKKYTKISGTWCYHEFKCPILLIIDLKMQIYFSTSKSL